MEVLLREQLIGSLSFPQVRVNDGEWHHLLVELRSVKDGKAIKYMATVSLDYGMYQVTLFPPSSVINLVIPVGSWLSEGLTCVFRLRVAVCRDRP